MPFAEVSALLEPLFSDIRDKEPFWIRKPLLAHYTSISTLESIVRNREVWFSNPLLMNDHEEMRFGIGNGMRAIREAADVRIALETDERREKFRHYIEHILQDFDEQHPLDVYVFCLSEHEKDDTDGRLSMWRGYGSDGNVLSPPNFRTGSTVVFGPR
jgi:hypothetical protein